MVFGFVLTIVSGVVWQFKHVRGIGDGLLTAGITIVLFVALRWLFEWMKTSRYTVCDRILRWLGFRGGA